MKNLTITFLFCLLLTGAYAQTVKDVDGNTYKTVKIGNQIWMAENLKTTHFNDGLPIPNVETMAEWKELESPAYCFYKNDEQNKSVYGAFYNWYAVETEKLCPAGWRVSTDEDWKQLEATLGISSDELLDKMGARGTNQGSQLAGSPELWRDWDGEGGLERDAEFGSSAFNALPGGFRSLYGRDGFIQARGVWWTSSLIFDNIGNSHSLDRSILGGGVSGVYRGYSSRVSGYSVRCVKE